MKASNKKIFLAATVIVPFLVYCIYYYGMMIKNAPYRFSDFQYLELKYGVGDSLVNQYNSKTGDYQYLTSAGKLVKKKLKLSNTALRYLHFKAAALGFWDFPEKELRGDTLYKHKAPKYYIEFHYKEKAKKVWFDDAYQGPKRLVEANQELIKQIQTKLDQAESLQEQNK